MVEETGPVVVDEFEDARIVEDGLTSYYLPNGIGKSEVIQEGASGRYDNVVEFSRNEESIRDPTSRAVYWAKLQGRVSEGDEKFRLPYDPKIKDIESVEELTIPFLIALAGNKAVYAAYLAAHGKPNSFISRVIGVSESTISQYLSDFKSDRR